MAFSQSLIDRDDQMQPVGALITLGSRRFDSQGDDKISGISINLVTDKASKAEIRFWDPDFSIFDLIIRQDEVRVWLPDIQGRMVPVFVGQVNRILRDNEMTRLDSFDRSFRMRGNDRFEYHQGTYAEILRTVVGRNGLSLRLESTSPAWKEIPDGGSIIQDELTDWEFARSICKELIGGHLIFAHGSAIIVRPEMDLNNLGMPTRSYEFGINFSFALGFIRRVDGKYQDADFFRAKQVEIKARKNKGQFLGKGGIAVISALKDVPSPNQTFLDAKAENMGRASAKYRTEGSIGIKFDPRLSLLNVVELKGAGQLLSKKYFVNEIVHSMNNKRLSTEIGLIG